MNTPSRLLLAGALAFATATSASAYQFSNPNASIRLHGQVTFTPNGLKPFTCGATIYLKTRTNLRKGNAIKSIKFTDGFCEGVRLAFLPWSVFVSSENSGGYNGGSFTSQEGNCVEESSLFSIDKSGVWTLPEGECLSGKLRSHPTTTIVP